MGKKVFLIIFFIILAIFINVPISKAVDDIKIDPNNWDPTSSGRVASLPTDVKNKVQRVLGAIQTFGIVISILSLMLIGIRTMYGSVEEKSAYKEAMPGYILGVIMVVAITTIPNLIYNALNS